MELIQEWSPRKSLFVFDLEFIGDVRKLNTCKIWEVAVFSLTSQQWFEAVIDPDPTLEEFPPPPIPEIPQLTREFLSVSFAQTWDIGPYLYRTIHSEQINPYSNWNANVITYRCRCSGISSILYTFRDGL